MTLLAFLLVAALLAATLIVVLTRPLWARGPLPQLQRAHRVAVRHLDRALRAGAIDAQFYASRRQELTARLTERLLAQRACASDAPPASRAAAVCTGLGVLLIVAGLYVYVGDPQALSDLAVTSTGAASTLPTVTEMVDGLAARLREHPDDPRGWSLLGRSYLVMGRYAAAADAYAQAHRLSGDDPDITANYAEALVLTTPQALTAQAADLIEQALAEAPSNPQALWLGGLLAQARGDIPLAARRWHTLLAQAGLPDDFRSAVQHHLSSLDPTAAAQASLTSTPPVSLDAQPARTDSTSPPGAEIDIKVSLAQALVAHVPADATLFVFARDARQPDGPPLAARRLTVGSLPAEVRLSGADAIMSGGTLDTHAALVLTARVTLHGGVTAQSGDLEGQASYAGDGRPTRLVIDRIVP